MQKTKTFDQQCVLGLVGIKDIDFVGRSEAETP